MSDILKSYFSHKDIKHINNSASKNLKLNKERLKLFNCGLFISESNILKIPRNKLKEHNKICNTIDSNDGYNTKSFRLRNKKGNIFLKDKVYQNFLDRIEKKNMEKINHNSPLFQNLSSKYILRKKISENETENDESILEDIKDRNEFKPKKLSKNEKKEVNKIINSFLNKEENNDKKTIFYHANSSQYLKFRKRRKKYYTKELFPREKSINPKAYIEYNFRADPNNKKLFKSYGIQVKCLNNEEENREKILKRVNESDKIRNSFGKIEVNSIAKNYDNELKRIENVFFADKKSYRFNTLDNENDIRDNRNRRERKIFKIDKSNVDLLTFDRKMNIAVTNTQNTLKYLKELSDKNDVLIKKITDLVYNDDNSSTNKF
jgi:uncharacterized protein YlaI